METLTAPSEKTFTKHGIVFTTLEDKGFYIARATKELKSQRISRLFGYKFRTEAQRDDHVKQYIAGLDKQAADKIARSMAVKQAKESLPNPFVIGDIFVNSWGYDQTQVDFYQVIDITTKSVVLQAIYGDQVEGSQGHDCCRVTPVKDAFEKNSEPFTKVVMIKCYSGRISYSLASQHGCLSKHEDGKDYYKSWYR